MSAKAERRLARHIKKQERQLEAAREAAQADIDAIMALLSPDPWRVGR